MFKKKRLFLIACIGLLAWMAHALGPGAAALCAAAFICMLGALKLWHVANARRGMAALAPYAPQCGVAAQLNALRALPVSDAPWRFIVMGDTRNNVRVARKLYELARNEQPDMLFHTGDIVRAGSARELIKNHLRVIEDAGLTCPVFCVPGNHERGPRRDFAAYTALYGTERFAFAHRQCLFVGINNSTRRGIGEDDLAFLERELAADARYKFVFLHIPPAFFEAAFVSDTRRRGFKKNADAFHQLMISRGVTEVFMAHIHGYATAVFDGVRYTLAAGGGAPLSRRLALEGRIHHLISFAISSDSLVRKVHPLL